MEDIHLSLLTVLPGVLLVLAALLLVLMAVRRRRALASRSHQVAMIDTIDGRAIVEALNAPNSDSGVVVLPVERPDGQDGEETDGSAGLERSSGVMASREQRRIVDTVLSPARRSHGRHSAVLPAPSGVLLLLLVPIAVKRRRRAREVSPRLGSTPTDSVDDVAAVEDPVGRELDTAVITAPGSSEASPEDHDAIAVAAEDIHIYRRRVNATIQAMTRRIGPGESPELVEARMLAAVNRLDGPVGFARPRLSPSGPHRSLDQLGHTPQTALPAGPAGLPSGELAADRPVGDESREADPPRSSRDAAPPEGLESEGAQPEGFALEDNEVVLPVPPLASSNDTRRRGLRRRG